MIKGDQQSKVIVFQIFYKKEIVNHWPTCQPGMIQKMP